MTNQAVAELIARSNRLGSDPKNTNYAGGNTSAKGTETDPVTGEPVELLWVKGSGGDLRTSTRENFSSLYQQKLLDLQKLYAARPDKGLKAPADIGHDMWRNRILIPLFNENEVRFVPLAF